MLNEYISIIEKRLIELIPDLHDRQQPVLDAMRYSLSAGGKRLRPILFLEFYRLSGGTNYSLALDYACALEMIHTYSLIHDDLPCMDDDDMRRGKPSCHKAFDYATALLAGDGLLNRAFEIMTDNVVCAEKQLKTSGYISKCSGVLGMIGGQTIDVCNNGCLNDVNELKHMISLKTGALIKAACVGGCLLAGADDKMINAADKYATYLGLSFQIRDDLLDAIGDEKTLGKKIGSDEKQNKTTFYSEYGLDGCEKEIMRLSELAIDHLAAFGDNSFLKQLTMQLTIRNK